MKALDNWCYTGCDEAAKQASMWATRIGSGNVKIVMKHANGHKNVFIHKSGTNMSDPHNWHHEKSQRYTLAKADAYKNEAMYSICA